MRGIAGALATIGLALVIIRFVTRYAAPSKSRVNAARAAGRSANAVVTDLRATNTEINEFRVYQIDLVVDSRDRAPYRTSMRRALDPIAGPNMSPGNVISVVRLREDKPEVAWDPETTPGHVSPTLVDRAGEWSPERSAGAGTGTGQIQKRPIRWGMLLLPLLFLGTGAAGYFGGQFYAESRAQAEQDAEQKYAASNFFIDAANLQTHLNLAFDEYGTLTSSVVIHPHHIVVEVESPENPGYFDRVLIRDGEAENQGAATTQPEPEEIFDAAVVDWSAIPQLYDDAVAIAAPALQENPERAHAVVQAPFLQELQDSGAEAQIRLFVSNDYESMNVDADEHGSLIATSLD